MREKKKKEVIKGEIENIGSGFIWEKKLFSSFNSKHANYLVLVKGPTQMDESINPLGNIYIYIYIQTENYEWNLFQIQ
jgi:hypothetical protein